MNTKDFVVLTLVGLTSLTLWFYLTALLHKNRVGWYIRLINTVSSWLG